MKTQGWALMRLLNGIIFFPVMGGFNRLQEKGVNSDA